MEIRNIPYHIGPYLCLMNFTVYSFALKDHTKNTYSMQTVRLSCHLTSTPSSTLVWKQRSSYSDHFVSVPLTLFGKGDPESRYNNVFISVPNGTFIYLYLNLFFFSIYLNFFGAIIRFKLTIDF